VRQLVHSLVVAAAQVAALAAVIASDGLKW
jgi:hypothetical protein